MTPTTLDPVVLTRLQTLAEGNPFFIEEIVRQLARPTAARLELSDLESVPVPHAIRVTVRRGVATSGLSPRPFSDAERLLLVRAPGLASTLLALNVALAVYKPPARLGGNRSP